MLVKKLLQLEEELSTMASAWVTPIDIVGHTQIKNNTENIKISDKEEDEKNINRRSK